ncbi:ATP-binding protein [Micromonospora sp. WMMD714]|uniref:sensor histidine kinase n=1 Tax=Micromonospora sp. WMMD714 TaxID=3016097 RepID=UPI00249A8E93|nr:ATP-binding protein [Micromonospora sp. WMMD714]WFE65984.1 histidine kinase [Micromonospora sp. WMMD714]
MVRANGSGPEPVTERGDPPRRRSVDAVVVAVALLSGPVVLAGSTASLRIGDSRTAVVFAAAAGALWWRRNAPVAVAWFAFACSAVLVAVETIGGGGPIRPDDNTVVFLTTAAPFAAYAVAVYAARRVSGWAAVVALLVAATAPWPLSWLRLRSGLVLLGVPVLLGLYLAARRRTVDMLRERARWAEADRHAEAERAVADERARLTVDLHDVVTHQVSLIVLEAGALGLTTTDQATRVAAERIREAGCTALDDLRDLVRVLPEQPPAREPVPVPLPDLRPLVGPAALTVTGTPVPVSPAVGQAVVRVVQEALTNVRKHAPGARVEVGVRYEGGHVRIVVRNGVGRSAADARLAASGSRTGLHGLRRRVELLGGTFAAGPGPQGGFTVRALLPGVPDGGSS